MITDSNPPLSLYIHYPWCVRKCPYCDFNSHEKQQHEITDKNYVDALIIDLTQQLPHVWGRKISSIFIGGGTPSLINPEALAYLFSQLRALLNLSPAIEITLEANPGTIDLVKFAEFKAIGINRLSIGVQSFNDNKLQQLGRIHSAKEAHQAIEKAQIVGFAQLNLDLMFALPEQTLAQANTDLTTAISYQPQHLSYYHLTIEPNTFFATQPPKLPNHDQAFSIQQQAYQQLIDAGYLHYEVSAWSQKNHECQHNLNYWQFGDYLAIGAGAHGKISSLEQQQIYRTSKAKQPKQYLQQMQQQQNNQQPPFISNTLSTDDKIFEFMLNASRLMNGVPLDLFSQRTGLKIDVLLPYLNKAFRLGLLKEYSQKIQATEKGFDYLNELQLIFLADN